MYSKDEEKAIRKEFWLTFEKLVKGLKADSGRKKRWMLQKTGIKGIQLKFSVTRRYVKIVMEFCHKDGIERLRLYEKLVSAKVLFVQIAGNDWIWEEFAWNESDGNEVSQIYCLLDNIDFMEKEKWAEIFRFMIEKMTLLEAALIELRDYIKYMNN
jgi:hypothetical protein